MRSKIFITLSVILLIGLVFFKNKDHDVCKETLTIGIIQTASHPALDQAREGFIQEMNSSLNFPVKFVIQNAEGSITQAQSIASHFHTHEKIQAIFAIGTLAVQAIARVEKEKPIFIAAVSDPESLGILETNKNICGTTDGVNTKAQAKLVLELIPQAYTLAIIYNPAEANSQTMVLKMQYSLHQEGFQTVLLGVHTEQEIAAAVHTAARKSTAIVTPCDNLLASAMPLLAQEALKHHLPLIVSDPLCVSQGALAATGSNYENLGKQTAILANRALFQKERPEDIGVVEPSHTELVINCATAQSLKLSLSNELIAQSMLIQDEKSNYVK